MTRRAALCRFLFVMSALVLASLPLGCGAAPAAPEEEKTPPATVKWEPARLLVLEEWTELLGTTQPLPDHEERITAPIEGRVLTILGSAEKPLVEGQPVQPGDVIAQLDARLVQADRDQAAAEQQALKEDLAQAESTRSRFNLEVQRLRPLEAAKAPGGGPLVPQIDVQKAKLALDEAESQVRAARARLAAGAQKLEALDVKLKLCTLTPRHKGRLSRIQVVPGQTLSVGALVAEVIDLDNEIDVVCFVPPSVARHLEIGQSARLGGLDATQVVPGDPEGKVAFIAHEAEPETGNLAVKVRYPNNEAHLRSNVVQRVRVLTRPGKECLAIPESALMEDQDPPTVVVVEDVTTRKNEEGKDEQVGKARRLQAVVGYRDRVLHQVEIVRLEDKEKKWKGSIDQALFVIEKGEGLQTGDDVKLEEEDED
jgi:multidrug efflux pump subunit AcrA (membrane-fusion protein)